MKGHQPSHISDAEKNLLRWAKRAPTKAHWNSPETITSLIAVGKITRENSCEGKARFRTYEYAEKEARPVIEERYETHLRAYACVWCGGFHLASQSEFAA